MSPEELINSTFNSKPLQFHPGGKYAYSNSGYILLAHIIETVTGQTYEYFLNEKIFKPLGMNNTGCDDHTKILEHRASGYEYINKELRNGEFLDLSFRIGCGNLYSTVEDLFLWDQALYTDKIVSHATLEKMFTSYSNGEYGYGWEVEKKNQTIRVGHSGASIGFFTDFSRYVEKGVVIIVLSNVSLTPTAKISDRIAKYLF